MLELRMEGEVEPAVVSLFPYEDLYSRLREVGLLPQGPAEQVTLTFVDRIAGKQMSPREIALNWAQSREIVMGKNMSLSKFIVGLHGSTVIKTLIPEKTQARAVLRHLSSAYSEVSKQT